MRIPRQTTKSHASHWIVRTPRHEPDTDLKFDRPGPLGLGNGLWQKVEQNLARLA